LGHFFKKQFGQNFLKSKRFISALVDPLNVTSEDLVIEVGPGDGSVTQELLKTGASVISFEVDYDLLAKLLMKFNSYDNFNLQHQDILQANIQEYLVSYNIPETGIKVTGSLPYNISKKIIQKFLTDNYKKNYRIDKMSFIVQDEVAKEYVAKPPDTNSLAAITNLFSKIKKLQSIPADNFYPTPKVDGGIIYFEPFEEITIDIEKARGLINSGFSAPRKTLLNNLKARQFSVDLTIVLKEIGIDEKSRPSNLTNEQWVQLANILLENI
jgi:16S rRNA (adenine1518-N6/adenine1519-N6)-dimethyltransferase